MTAFPALSLLVLAFILIGGSVNGESVYAAWQKHIEKQVAAHPVVLYSKSTCPWCHRAKAALNNYGIAYWSYEYDLDATYGRHTLDAVSRITGHSTVPQVFVCGSYLGECACARFFLVYFESIGRKAALNNYGIAYWSYQCDLDATYGRHTLDAVSRITGHSSVPQVFVSGSYLGGSSVYGESVYAAWQKRIEKQVAAHPVVLYSKSTCPWCHRAKAALNNYGIAYWSYEYDLDATYGRHTLHAVARITGHSTVPQVFVCGSYLGGYTELVNNLKSGRMATLVSQCSQG